MRKALARMLPLSLLIARRARRPRTGGDRHLRRARMDAVQRLRARGPAGHEPDLARLRDRRPAARERRRDAERRRHRRPRHARRARAAPTRRYTFGFPTGTGGTYDEYTGKGTVELAGTVTFTSAAHGFTISVEDPQLKLDGNGGQLFASGVRSGDPGHLRPQRAGLRPRPLRRGGHAAPGRQPHAERDRAVDRHGGLRLPGLRPGRRP